MKRSKITLGIMTSLLACSVLAGCNGAKYSPEGYILTYKDSAGNEQHYTAKDLFDSYYEDSSKVSSMFDSIYKLIVRNYFTEGNAGHDKYNEILKNAKNDVEGVKSKASENADANDSDYDTEFHTLLESYSCKDEAELLQHFIYERELSEFNEQFYSDDNMKFLRDHKVESTTEEDPERYVKNYEGYISKKLPYHVRHILVKIADTGSTNFWNATIDENDAIELYDVVRSLAEGKQSFGKIAQLYSEDGSKDKFGDLGIMDYDTSFVNEFKLGIFAAENLYNNATKEAVKTSHIYMGDPTVAGTIAKQYSDVVGSSIGKIKYGSFLNLYDTRKTTKDDLNRDVNDGNANYFPRNIYFNNDINLHSVNVIVPEDGDLWDTARTATNYAELTGFSDQGDGFGNCLRTTDGQPILVVRAGTSDYQGIHFIVVERTPLVDETSYVVEDSEGNPHTITVNNSEYYTIKYPGQENYPEHKEDTGFKINKQTYVNFLNLETKELKSRAETVQKQIKNFDTDLNKFIYHKYLTEEKIVIKDEALKAKIEKWIDASAEGAEYDRQLAWEKTWETYLDSLKVQNAERTKVIKKACAIGFMSHTGADWQEGGDCYDNKIRG